jgi:hypothetical protein
MLTLIILPIRSAAGPVLAVSRLSCELYCLLSGFVAFRLRPELLIETLCQGTPASFQL